MDAYTLEPTVSFVLVAAAMRWGMRWSFPRQVAGMLVTFVLWQVARIVFGVVRW